MNVALILVSLGIANSPLPIGHPLVVAYFEDIDACVMAANQAKLPVAGIPGRALNTWVQFVCVPACPFGIQTVHGAHPDVPIIAAAIDPQLNDIGYIVPGLGDAGDRYFGTG